MEGLSREREAALGNGMGRGTQGVSGPETDALPPKRDGCKANALALPVCEGQTMRRWKPRRGGSVIGALNVTW